MPNEIEQLKQKLQQFKEDLERKIQDLILHHRHNGIDSDQVHDINLFGNIKARIQSFTQTIATTGNTDFYIITPFTGFVESVDFSGIDALTTSDTNYITFSITNLGQSGSGTTAMLDGGAGNTTKATGGTAISANTKRALTLSASQDSGLVAEGDRLRVRAAVTGTLANAVTGSIFLLRFK